jgi:hypothetical protein
MAVTLTIARSDVPAECAWPEGTSIQGSAAWSSRRFVEVSVPVGGRDTWLHVDGESIAAAEEQAFAYFTRYSACDGHEFERGSYRNGAATCGKCGMWSPDVFDPLERCVECGTATYHATRDGRWWCELHSDLAPKPQWLLDIEADEPNPDDVAAAIPAVLTALANTARQLREDGETP